LGRASHDDGPLRREDLLIPFREGAKPRDRFRIGTEAEKFGVYVADGRPIPYGGPRGVLAVMRALCDRYGWTPQSEREGGEVIALRRGDASITLEPGCQLELSGAPQKSVHDTCAEFTGHLAELAQISAELGIVWLGLGFHPFAARGDLDWVPKERYGVMREYLPTRGAMALDMMQRTCTVQANVDFEDEEDAVRKTKVALAISPVVTAMFANGPFAEGERARDLSVRARAWLSTDPDRCGALPFAFEEDFGFERYVEWALDVPMFLFKRDGRGVRNTGQTFRDFWTHGFEGWSATRADWESHLQTLFPEVRLKRTIELRGADSVPTALLCALPAFWKGILYDDDAADAALRLVADWTAEERLELRREIPALALGSAVRGTKLVDVACDLLDLAVAGLRRQAVLSRRGRDESAHLDRLQEMVEDGHCPADLLARDWDPHAPDPIPRLIALAKY
jgi:glutamate--cysteine ligase